MPNLPFVSLGVKHYKSIEAGNPLDADIERLENWSKDQAATILEAFTNATSK